MSFKPQSKSHPNRKPRFSTPISDNPLPVKNVKPLRKPEPAELCTIASIILRRNIDLYKSHQGDEDLIFLGRMKYESGKRTLTNEESRKVLALITWLKGRQ